MCYENRSLIAKTTKMFQTKSLKTLTGNGLWSHWDLLIMSFDTKGSVFIKHEKFDRFKNKDIHWLQSGFF